MTTCLTIDSLLFFLHGIDSLLNHHFPLLLWTWWSTYLRTYVRMCRRIPRKNVSARTMRTWLKGKISRWKSSGNNRHYLCPFRDGSVVNYWCDTGVSCRNQQSEAKKKWKRPSNFFFQDSMSSLGLNNLSTAPTDFAKKKKKSSLWHLILYLFFLRLTFLSPIS
jgi:hypothetical protein